jgi:large subunit ribosomal protein L28
MARRCKLSGKRPMVGYSVSHAHNKTKRRQYPNIQSKRFFVPELKRWVRIRLSTRAIKTITERGLLQYLRDKGLTLKDVM